MEVYEWKTRRDNKSYLSPDTMLSTETGFEEILQDPNTLSESPITMANVGASPYQIPDFCRNFIFGKKTTFQLAPGGTSTYTRS